YLVAVGLVLIFGLRRVVNFAHGALFMVGAYVGFSAAALGNYWVALVVAVLVLAVLGGLLDAIVFRPLQRHDPIVTVLVTFGLLMVLEDVAQTIWGKEYRTLPTPPILSGTVMIAGEAFPVYRLMVVVVAGLVALGLMLWLRYSRIGLFVRASSADPVTTAVQGVDTNRVSVTVVAIGAGLAGLSGTIAAPLLAISPSMGSYILVESFIVIVIGGLGSFGGALIAALVIGQIYNWGVVHLPWAATMIPFLLMVAVLIWRPQGLAGKHV
ncbi:MAG TPA: branched-chain amino acid ABC transporter permease, partial [Ramlibacter sp.]|nr:branched-chain amino acid ABC transporter permease [Ramlibacter sp.]